MSKEAPIDERLKKSFEKGKTANIKAAVSPDFESAAGFPGSGIHI
jgi:hypothetical protein